MCTYKSRCLDRNQWCFHMSSYFAFIKIFIDHLSQLRFKALQDHNLEQKALLLLLATHIQALCPQKETISDMYNCIAKGYVIGQMISYKDHISLTFPVLQKVLFVDWQRQLGKETSQQCFCSSRKLWSGGLLWRMPKQPTDYKADLRQQEEGKKFILELSTYFCNYKFSF